MKKLFLSLGFLAATISPWATVQKVEASPGLALGIIGTALGGTALGLGVYNTIQNRRLRNEYYSDRYYDQDDYYYDDYRPQRAAYNDDYSYDDGYYSDYYYY